jgi:hypothetical protein
MSYVARVVIPTGTAWFLWRGKHMANPREATQHQHPSAAQRAANRYRAKHPRCIADWMDMNADGASE